ncbi:major vault protein isoform X1 [Ciona intestinalis]
MSKGKSGISGSGEEAIYRIPPYYYIHVLDQNTNVTKLEIGPKTYIRQDNERVIFGPERMITIPPRHYCVIQNPVAKNADDQIQLDPSGQAKLNHADQEIRLAQDPFPLYPGEVLKTAVTPLRVVTANTALRLRAELDFDEGDTHRVAGDEWLFEGPGTYIPRKEVSIEETIRATVIKRNQAIKLRARKETKDRDGVDRVTGEEWLIKKVGAYLPGAYEEVVDVVNAYVLTEKVALHMQATRTFTDFMNQKRKNGEEWLIKMTDTESHIPDVHEEVMGIVNVTTLTSRQYCVILNPVGANGKNQLGNKKLIKGESSFFIQPGEKLEKGIQDVYVLGEDEGLILKAEELCYDDENERERKPGDKWMIRGPCEYVPPVKVNVFAKRKSIYLDENEGIYVREMKTGKVRSVCGHTYMLTQDEELWAKNLSSTVEGLLASGRDPMADRGTRNTAPASGRDKTKVVTFRVPHNACVQIYDYKNKKARVVFGPHLVMLGPDEQFTQLSLSGGKPKRPNVIRALALLLGPDFCTDVITIETADHARLSLQLAYNWYFDISKAVESQSEAAKLFSVPDFVGDLCKAVASRIRGAVASVSFDDFHKNSSRIIRSSVFGIDDKGKVKDRFEFPQNRLVVTSIDIQSVEPVDQRTRDSLVKSVQLAIEITTNSQEATARHEAERAEQEARGRLERQKIADEAEAERSRRDLLELQSQSAAIESTGQAKAEAQSRAEAARIEGEAAVEQARLKANAASIEAASELERLTKARDAELKYMKEQNELQLNKDREIADIETRKFKDTIDAIGADTIRAIAVAGPEMQVKLLSSLGIQSTIFTDGKSPINLFNTANGLIGATAGVAAKVPAVLHQAKRARQTAQESDDE